MNNTTCHTSNMKSVIYILLVLPLVWSFNPSCKVQQILTSPYIFKGTGGIYCQYLIIAPLGSKINMQCSFYILNQNSCNETIVYANNGDFMTGYSFYCNTGRFNMVSTGDRFAVGVDFRKSQSNFTCTAYISTPLAAGQCDCGWKPQSRILGGSIAAINEYTFMVGILSSTTMITVGTIISNRHVLTTAYSISNYTISSVVVGDYDLTTAMEAPSTEEIEVQYLSIHPQYNALSRQNDIAIVHTNRDIKFFATVGPVCLPFNLKNNLLVYYRVIAAGWGGAEADNATDYSSLLKSASFTILSNADCQSKLSTNIITANQICSHSNVNDLCAKDAGGPLVYWNSAAGRYILIGLISYSLQCSRLFPAVHTRVTSYLDWIESQTSGTTFCKK